MSANNSASYESLRLCAAQRGEGFGKLNQNSKRIPMVGPK